MPWRAANHLEMARPDVKGRRACGGGGVKGVAKGRGVAGRVKGPQARDPGHRRRRARAPVVRVERPAPPALAPALLAPAALAPAVAAGILPHEAARTVPVSPRQYPGPALPSAFLPGSVVVSWRPGLSGGAEGGAPEVPGNDLGRVQEAHWRWSGAQLRWLCGDHFKMQGGDSRVGTILKCRGALDQGGGGHPAHVPILRASPGGNWTENCPSTSSPQWTYGDKLSITSAFPGLRMTTLP